MNPKPIYKYCIVPCCKNSTANTKEKLFFSVPKDPSKRKAWTRAVKRDEKLNKELSSVTTLWCCEDHFSLEEDMENYWQWKLMGNVKKLLLKPGVIPHIFDCQKKDAQPPVERKAAQKRKRMSLVREAIESCSVTKSDAENNFDANELSTSVSVSNEDPTFDMNNPISFDKAVQANLKKPFRSIGINTFVSTNSVACATTRRIKSVGTNTSPNKFSEFLLECFETSSSEFETPSEEESSESLSSDDDTDAIQNMLFIEHMIKGTLMAIEKEPRLYLGLPKQSFFLINLLVEHSKVPVKHIYIVLKKIRCNPSFASLAIDFGMVASSVWRIFAKSLCPLASCMQELIVWPEQKAIQARLPIPFYARYGHVISLIDCLEIEIEKPTNPVQQALTWSNYYGCNTLKYLVSCTPDGLISFISEGFGGRASDVIIVEQSGYLDKLVQDSCIMADRGFKNISHLLQAKNCTLVRPPSVSCDTRSSKAEVKQAKRIAALRIHVERLIRRLREFDMLAKHACVDRQLLSVIDYAVIISCGIINLQDQLIKGF